MHAFRPRTPLTRTLALVGLLALGGCSERQIEPDYSEYIEEVCTAVCPVTTECVDEPFYSSTEECIAGCSTAETWDDLNQCDSRSLELSACIAELSCAEYLAHVEAVFAAVPEFPPEGTACRQEIIADRECDPNEPFEPPE